MMAATLAEGQIRKAERLLGVPMDYMRMVWRHSRRTFLWIGLVRSAMPRPRAVPLDVWHMAGLAAAMVEDCGTCVQIHVNLARKDGLPPQVLGHAVAGRMEALPPDLALAARFGRATAENNPEQNDLREAVVARFGEAALVDLAVSIAMARFWPTTKRVLGHAVACSRVEVQGLT